MKTKLSFLSLAVFVICLVPAISSGSILFKGSYLYEATKFNQSDAVNKTTLDATVAFVMPVGLYVGASYDAFNWDESFKFSGYGPTVGFWHMGFHIDVTYLFSVSGTLGSSDLTEGTGTLIRVGYAHMFTDTIGLGPSIVNRSVKFEKVGSAEITYEYTETVPSIDLILSF